MSDIDLKALRKFALFQRDDEIGLGVVCHTAAELLALLDRLESAERRAEEAEKERDALLAEVTPYRAIMADGIKQLEQQILYGTSDKVPVGLMAQEGGK